jgi:hypothetical protein
MSKTTRHCKKNLKDLHILADMPSLRTGGLNITKISIFCKLTADSMSMQ